MTDNEPFWRRLQHGWLAIVARFGFVQTQLLLVLIYVFLIGPVGIVMMIGRSDQLSKRGIGAEGSAWNDADTAAPDLERSKRLS